MIRDFIQNETVTAFCAVRRKEIKEYGSGKFISFEFGDASGRIGAVMWEPDDIALNEIFEGDVVKVRGVVGQYRGRNQLKVQLVRFAQEDEYDISDLIQRSEKTEEELREKIFELSALVENEFIKKLINLFWDDEEFLKSYLIGSAGKLWHHSYIGGLAEHSINVTEICVSLSSRYPFLDRDLLVFGGLFHDMGKIMQYEISTYIDFSDEGELLGHISPADSQIVIAAGEIEDFPSMLLAKLRHMILSHHGNLEFASPVVPKLPEAFLLYYADELDSKMGAIERIRNKAGGTGWSEYINLLQRKIYFGEEE